MNVMATGSAPKSRRGGLFGFIRRLRGISPLLPSFLPPPPSLIRACMAVTALYSLGRRRHRRRRRWPVVRGRVEWREAAEMTFFAAVNRITRSAADAGDGGCASRQLATTDV